MEEYSQISEFGKVLIFLIMGVFFVMATFLTSKLVAPNKPNEIKNSSYECGEVVTGSSWLQFNSRFYVIAVVFLLFDVEMIFVFPWSTIFSDANLIALDARWGWLSFIEMMIFIGILLLGLVYVWKKNDLNWDKPKVIIPTTDTKIPMNAYEALNKKEYVPFEGKIIETAAITTPTGEVASEKPKFVPRFKKTS